MTECCRRMLDEEESDSSESGRERRRRRIQMRRVAAAAASTSVASAANRPPEEARPVPAQKSAEEASSSGVGDDVAVPAEDLPATEPVFGTLSIPGRSRYMEDAVSVRTAVASPEVALCRPVHFFAVYDGHGGPHVADLCKERMHVIVSEEMGWLRYTRGADSGGGSGGGVREAAEEEWWWRRVMKRSFARMDEEAMNTCACGSVGHHCSCQLVGAAVGGSTAAVVLLTPNHIVVANVGDSRAVLRRDGNALPLSQDHKPDRSDELARIEAAGGRVIFVNGARVEGILAMSRAIGDKYLKRFVISEPEITFTKREPRDECLIIASDGMWDVLSNDLACRVAGECLREGAISSNPANAPAVDATATASSSAGSQEEEERARSMYPSRSTITAALLTRLALGRRSSDNISVIVVDLKRSK